MADYYDFGFDTSYTPTTDFSSGADYSFDAGSAGGSYGLQAPSYSPTYDPSVGADYGFVAPGGSGGYGVQAPSYDFGYTPSFGSSAGAGYQAPQSGGSWWDSVMPTASFAPTNYGLTTGTGTGGGAPTLQMGSGAPGLQGPTLGAGPQLAATPAVGNAGVTGEFGGAGTQGEGLGTQAENWLQSIENWGRQNPRLASLLTQGVGAIAGLQSQRRANDLIERQLNQQREQYALQQQAFNKNAQVADMRNQLAQQQVNQALSLYNPQELAQRGMAQQQAATGRQLQQLEQQMASRGYSPADIAAAKRRAQVGGALNATQGYMQGYDTGRTAQQGALTSAVGLGQRYDMPQGAPDMSQAAQALSQMGATAGKNYSSLLSGVLGSPTLEATKRSQEEASKGTRKRAGLPT